LARLVLLSGRTEESVKLFLNDVSRYIENNYNVILKS